MTIESMAAEFMQLELDRLKEENGKLRKRVIELEDIGTDLCIKVGNLKKAKTELLKALDGLVCCPAFTGALFEVDKESHRAWTLAGAAITDHEER